jgi:hypothetical protein
MCSRVASFLVVSGIVVYKLLLSKISVYSKTRERR